jgi:phenylacetate-coenzyme A ligase PaaK-like adenylate-forming protein
VSLNTTPSAAVGLSLAAQSRGVNLKGLSFLLGAEPLTEVRRTTIEACGARAIPLYGSTEAVWTGGQCPHPRQGDEVHVLGDLHAVVNGDSTDAYSDGEAPSVLFTSIAPLTPKVLINTDIGDRGYVGERRCDCLYDEVGCRQTIHSIRSSDKLTEFGVTIWVADVYQVLEDVLPKRLGGAAGDFQLIETRTETGLPSYVLLAHPRLGRLDERSLPKLFLSELSQLKSYYGFMTAIWEREAVLGVARRPPVATRRGKILPFLRLPALPPA